MLNESFRTILCWYLNCRSSIWCPCRYQHQYMPTDQIINDMVSVWLCRSLFETPLHWQILCHDIPDDHFGEHRHPQNWMSGLSSLLHDVKSCHRVTKIPAWFRWKIRSSTKWWVFSHVVCYSRRFLLSHGHCDGHVDIFRTGWMDWPGYYTP